MYELAAVLTMQRGMLDTQVNTKFRHMGHEAVMAKFHASFRVSRGSDHSHENLS